MSPAEETMAVLMSTRAQGKARHRVFKLSCGLSLFFALLAALMFGPRGGYFSGVVTLWILPLLIALVDARFLATFRAAGALEELQQTRLTASDMVDGTVAQSLRWSIQPLLKAQALFLVGALLLSRPGLDRLLLVQKALMWAPIAVFLFWIFGYMAQMVAAYGDGGGSGMTSAALAPLCILPLAFALLAGAFGTPLQKAAVYITAALAVGVVSRLLAVWAAGRGQQFAKSVAAAKQAKRAGARNTHLRPWSDNPIVVRECARDAARVGGGWLGYFAERYMLALCCAVIPVSALLFAVELGIRIPQGARSSGLWLAFAGLYFLVHPTRTAGRISTALVEEREKGTLESLAVTPLGREEFVDGWAEVGWRPRYQENLLAVPLLFFLGHWCGVSWALLILVSMLYFINSVAGAYLGFALGTWAPSRSESSGDFGVIVVFGCALAISIMGCLMGYSPLVIGVCLVALSAGLAHWARNLSLALVSS